MKLPFLGGRKRKEAYPPDVFLYQDPRILLHRHRGLLQEVRRMVGLPDWHYSALYTPLFLQHADFCQELPASEAHHHCAPGGALRHGIEVALHAMRLRRKILLPAGASAEELAAKQDRWTYAVVSAALFHDFGKPVTDLMVEMLDQDGKYLDTWKPWLGPMGEQGCKAYRMRYNRDRRHGLHERLPAFFAHRLLPSAGLDWLTQDLEVFESWSAAMVGDWEHAGPIGEIVQLADARSVAEDLAGDHKQAPGARQKPLHERLLTGLRYLLDQGELPLNARGAAGWIHGDSLWLVSKRTLDALRDHLEREGHGGIPSRNDRLMDALQQAGCLVPNGDKAIWNVRVIADGWPKAVELTVLRFPLNRIWPDPTAVPSAFEGSILIDSTETEEPENASREAAQHQKTTSPETPQVSATDCEGTADAGAAKPLEAQPKSPHPIEKTPEEENSHPAEEAPPLAESGQRFLTWLRENMARGLLEINSPSGRIHRVQEGLLLISPGLFKDYRDPHPDASWQQVQRRFSRLKLHRKCPDGTNIHAYDVVGEKSRKRSVVKGYLLPDEELGRIFPNIPLPAPNPHLKARASGPGKTRRETADLEYSNASLEQDEQGGIQ